MLWVDGKLVEAQMTSGVKIESMWLNGHLIWLGIRSCYGGGGWINSKPYLNNDAWKD